MIYLYIIRIKYIITLTMHVFVPDTFTINDPTLFDPVTKVSEDPEGPFWDEDLSDATTMCPVVKIADAAHRSERGSVFRVEDDEVAKFVLSITHPQHLYLVFTKTNQCVTVHGNPIHEILDTDIYRLRPFQSFVETDPLQVDEDMEYDDEDDDSHLYHLYEPQECGDMAYETDTEDEAMIMDEYDDDLEDTTGDTEMYDDGDNNTSVYDY